MSNFLSIENVKRNMIGLEHLQAVKGQHNKVSAEDAIAAIKRGLETDQASLDAEDEEMVRQMFSQRTSQVGFHIWQHIRLSESWQACGIVGSQSCWTPSCWAHKGCAALQKA